ncbi:lipopolysaccharide biosynthesis protein [Ureibacillus sp. MALMAid1270]|uniref:lipopolysaccharide biosynthesis protein n=1 Tax=Ureibacillus sp. MALMAid1270 TaxID=3411629 RepID=UPI003BA3E971
MGYGYEITKVKVISSLLWKIAERMGTQSIQLLVIILLARLLLPEDFGLIVIVTIFITIGGYIVDSGFTEALIQKKDVDELDFSSVFYLNLITASLLYIIFFFIAPVLAHFFSADELTIIIRILSICLFFNAINSVQNAIISRQMQHKKLFTSGFSAILISGIVGITMALMNFGILALVAQQLTHRTLLTFILWFTVKWRPLLYFSFSKIRTLFSYGWKLLLSTLLYSSYLQLHNFIIGKVFSPAVLGFYSRGMQFPSIIVDNINGSIQTVLFPAMASQQENIEKMKAMLHRLIVLSSFITFPMMVGLAAITEPLVLVLLTDKWLPTVPLLQIFCAYYALWAIDISNLQVIKALGRSDLYLILEIVKLVNGLIILVIGIQFGISALAIGVFVNGLIGTIVGGVIVSRLLNDHVWNQWKGVIPTLLISLSMGAIVYSIKFIGLSSFLTLMIQVVTGVIIYVGLAIVFKNKSFTDLLSLFKTRKEKHLKLEGVSNH